MLSCECEIVEFTNASILKYMGRSWSIGPVGVMQDPVKNIVKVCLTAKQYKDHQIAIREFREAIGANSALPILLKVSVEGNRGPYGMGEVEFDDRVTCKLQETHLYSEIVELVFEQLQKGKELKIFHGISDTGEQSGNKKPLFWASILKGHLH